MQLTLCTLLSHLQPCVPACNAFTKVRERLVDNRTMRIELCLDVGMMRLQSGDAGADSSSIIIELPANIHQPSLECLLGAVTQDV